MFGRRQTQTPAPWAQQAPINNYRQQQQRQWPGVPQDTVGSGAQRNGPIVKSCDDFKVVIILDESGSMRDVASDMIGSLNGLIKEQSTIDRPCRFTLVKFNDKIKHAVSNKNMKLAKTLSAEDFQPSGSTALFDAIGDTIDRFRYEKDVLMVIITDGHENVSSVYKKAEIQRLMDEKKDHRGWSYVYLGNDLSVAKQGNELGCRKSAFASNCQVSKNNYGKFIDEDLNDAIRQCRTQGTSVQMQLNQKY